MQTLKYFVAAGVLAAVILPVQVQGGPDSEEQAKMRAALRRAIEQPNTPGSQPAAVAPPAQAEPVVATPPPQPQSTPPPVTPVAPPPPAPATATVVVATPQTFEPVPPPDDAAAIARAREALRQKMLELDAKPAPAPAPGSNPVAAVAPPPVAKPAAPVAPPVPAAAFATSNYKPIDVPASPFSSSKQAKLADLLSRYRADSITAQEYHAQRAVIIAEP